MWSGKIEAPPTKPFILFACMLRGAGRALQMSTRLDLDFRTIDLPDNTRHLGANTRYTLILLHSSMAYNDLTT